LRCALVFRFQLSLRDIEELLFKRVLRSNPVPRKIVTDHLRSYPAAEAETPKLANAKQVFVKADARLLTQACVQRPCGDRNALPRARLYSLLHLHHPLKMTWPGAYRALAPIPAPVW